MDHDIRTLERLALQGDSAAALAFVAAHQRTKSDKAAHHHTLVLKPGTTWKEVITTEDSFLVGIIPQELADDGIDDSPKVVVPGYLETNLNPAGHIMGCACTDCN